MTEPATHVGTSGQPHPVTRCRIDYCGDNPPGSGTWGAPNLASGHDDFRAKQQPDVRPVDDLSRFVLDRIREAETEPVVDGIPKLAAQSREVMAHRYAGHVRRDMVAFRRIVAGYCAAKEQLPDADGDEETCPSGQMMGFWMAVLAIACRFDDHPDFKAEWRLE